MSAAPARSLNPGDPQYHETVARAFPPDPKPAKRQRGGSAADTWLRKPKAPIGEAKRVTKHNEVEFYPAFERFMGLHRLDWWHCTVAQASQPGYPDYTIWGDGWHAWVELKARQANNKAGTLSTAQKRYRASIERGAGEYMTFLLPDDIKPMEAWFTSHTGRVVAFQ